MLKHYGSAYNAWKVAVSDGEWNAPKIAKTRLSAIDLDIIHSTYNVMDLTVDRYSSAAMVREACSLWESYDHKKTKKFFISKGFLKLIELNPRKKLAALQRPAMLAEGTSRVIFSR